MILAIETSGGMSSVAVLNDGRVAAELSFPSRQELSQTLIGRIDAVLAQAGVKPEQLGAVAVSLGPGSFTSLRIGVVTAKALAHALRLPIVGVPTPHAIAAGAGPRPGEIVVVVSRARADEAYVSILEAHPDGFAEPRPCTVMTDAEVEGMITEMAPPPRVCREATAQARDVGRLALLRLRRQGPDDAFSLTPIYVRPSQAEALFGRGPGSGFRA
jgi:tRNA threonylcarbamoyladenosine biosynthesis protein TsaB